MDKNGNPKKEDKRERILEINPRKKKSKKKINSYIDLSKGSDDDPSIIAELRQYAMVGKQEYPQNPSLRVVTDEDIFKDLSPINPDIMTPPMQRSITSNNQNSNFKKRLSFEDDDDDDDDVNMTRNDSPLQRNDSPLQFKVLDESWTRTFGGKRKKTRKRTKRRRKKRKTKKRRK